MSPELEEHLWERLREGKKPREVIDSMLDVGSLQSPKQAWATLSKWGRQGLYDWGVTIDLGWLNRDARLRTYSQRLKQQAGER